MDYGLLRYVDRAPELQSAAEPQIHVNYLGRLDLGGATDQPWSILTGPFVEAIPIAPEPDLPLHFGLYINAVVAAAPEGSQLITNLLWSDALFTQADVDRIAHYWQRSVAALAADSPQ